MKTKRSAFNLVEITLAIAVVGIGIASILAIFTPAVDATKNSIADNYTADVANTFKAFITAEIKKDAGAWDSMVGTQTSGAIPQYPELEDSTLDELPAPDSGFKLSDLPTDDSGWTAVGTTFPGIYTITSTPNLFGVKAGTLFVGHLRLWKQPVKSVLLNNNTFVYEPTAVPYNKAAMIFMELSWPIIKKYEDREKRLYVMEVYK